MSGDAPEQAIGGHLQELILTLKRLEYVGSSRDGIGPIASLALAICACLRKGGKILLFGNGGSAADAQHIAAEFVVRYKKDREPLAAIALTTDASILTAIGNDLEFERIFSRQISAFGKHGDVVIGLSTSGESENVYNALKLASAKLMVTAAITRKGSPLGNLVDYLIEVPSDETAHIQECTMAILHAICEVVDQTFQ
jgi:D-sedoheptulose 7-phosphate isomerase